MQKREHLLDNIKFLIEENDGELPLISLDDFFEGNHDEGSLGIEQNGPSIDQVYKKLKQIEKLPNVCSVLVEIHDDWEMSLNNAEVWPAAQNVYVYTMAQLRVIRQWTVGLPCHIYEGWIESMPLAAPSVPPGYLVYTLHWS